MSSATRRGINGRVARAHTWTRRHASLLGILLLSVPAAFLSLRYREVPQVGKLWDEGVYVVSAKSLAEGVGYRILSAPGQPYQTKYPPLFPLLLSMIWRLNPHFPENMALVSLLSFLLLPPFLRLLHEAVLDMKIAAIPALLGCALVASSRTILVLSVTPMSELLFCCLLFSALLILGRSHARQRATLAFLAGLLGGAAYLTRTAGLAFLLAGILFLLIRKRRTYALTFCLGMLPAIAAWNLWLHWHTQAAADYPWAFYTNYSEVFRLNISFATLPVFLAKNWIVMSSCVPALFLDWPATGLWGHLLLTLLGLVLIGAAVATTRKADVTQYHLFSIIYCAMLLVWPYPPDTRLLVPALPVLLTGLLRLATDFQLRLGKMKVLSWCAAIGFLACLAAYQTTAVSNILAGFRSERPRDARAYAWINHSLPATTRFVTDCDTAVYLQTGHQAIGYFMPMRFFYFADPKAQAGWFQGLPRFAEAHGLDYLLSMPGHSITAIHNDAIRQYEGSSLQRFAVVYADGIVIRRLLKD